MKYKFIKKEVITEKGEMNVFKWNNIYSREWETRNVNEIEEWELSEIVKKKFKIENAFPKTSWSTCFLLCVVPHKHCCSCCLNNNNNNNKTGKDSTNWWELVNVQRLSVFTEKLASYSLRFVKFKLINFKKCWMSIFEFNGVVH